MGARRKARELALQILYAYEINKDLLSVIIQNFFDGDIYKEKDFTTFSETLVKVTIEKLPEINKILQDVITNWSINRLAIVDKNVLRLATAELLFMEEIPPKVTINEYIEIAKKFGDGDSPAFVNGILDKVVHFSKAKSEKLSRN